MLLILVFIQNVVCMSTKQVAKNLCKLQSLYNNNEIFPIYNIVLLHYKVPNKETDKK